MKKIGIIFFVALAVLTGCHGIDPIPVPGTEQDEGKVEISFKVAVPSDGTDTRAMGNAPTIDTTGFYVAVFGGSGYFNEWVRATVTEVAPAHYDGTNATVYSLQAKFSISDSRLRLHFIANCPTAVRTSPPISGSQDTEEYVMSRIRSQRTETYNDAYWQKVILPNGVRVTKVGNTYVATDTTMAQFPDPIILVRNFARVYLRNLTQYFDYTDDPSKNHQLVTIKKFGLAYAPSEGVVAPILSAPYTSNSKGAPIAEPAENDSTTQVYFENFLINYQRYPIASENPGDTLVTGAPFNYGGYSPSNQAYNYYPGNADVGVPTEANLQVWDDSVPENNVLFVYERTMPSAARRATRVIILAERKDFEGESEGDKFYALDIVNTEGVTIPLLRNQTYTVHLLNIEAGSGETDISKASKATSATVTGDPTFQNLINISDGKSSIGTSFTEKFYVKPQRDTLMFRYIPTNVQDSIYTANQEANELVTIKVGSLDENSGVFTELTAAQASSQGILAFDTATNAQSQDTCKVWIVKDNTGKAISFVRNQNDWVAATAEQIANPDIEKWGMIVYDLNESYKDEDGFFTQARTQAIHVEGAYGTRVLSRNVVIKTSQRQTMDVTCRQKYVMQKAGEEEIVRIRIPKGLSRSVFPLEFTIEPDGYSLTPDGDVLPVAFGSSTVPGSEIPAFYFIKTVTQSEYDGLSTDGDWKYFDCHFKTTIAKNACTVYVYNKYFNDATSHDDFFNFKQRLFTFPNSPWSATTVDYDDNVTLTFRMDYANNGNVLLWWDPANPSSLDSTKRVLPHVMTVILNGFTPQYKSDNVSPETAGLEHYSGNIYRYNIPDYFTELHSYPNEVVLKLKAKVVGTGSVTLTTQNITENPDLYASATPSTSVTIRGSSFTTSYSGTNYTNSRLALGTEKSVNFNITYANGKVVPVTLSFDGFELDGTSGINAQLTDNGNGTYTFTPTGTGTGPYTVALKTTTRFSPCSVTLVGAGYETKTTIAQRTASFTIPANALYARNAAGTGAATNIDSYSVYLRNTAAYTASGSNSRFRSNNSYYNNSAMTVTLSDFTIVNDDAEVYFVYRAGNQNSSPVYIATSSLSELITAQNSNSGRVALRFKGSSTVTINTTSTNYNNRLSYTNSNVTVAFSGLTNRQNGYVTVPNSATVTVSVPSGYHISGMTFTYNRGGNYGNYTYYVPQTVSVSTGSYSGSLSSTTATWTPANNTTTSTVFTLTKQSSTDIRLASIAVTMIED